MKNDSIWKQMARGMDQAYKRRAEFKNGKIAGPGSLFVLIPDDPRPPGRHRIKPGAGLMSEHFDRISLDVLGRKMKLISGAESMCRGWMLDYPFIERPYFHFSVPLVECRKCRYYLKRNKTRFGYPVCGHINEWIYEGVE